MKLAVMQPYLFPYIGYFQLIYASDLFLIYDDVNYIKKGYINRNSILSSNGAARFTLPVIGASQNKLISELYFSKEVSKILKTIEQSYSKSPFFDDVFPLIRETLNQDDRSIAAVCLKSYQAIFSYLALDKQIKRTSHIDYDRTLSAKERLIILSKIFNANVYINSPGGKSLYSKQEFHEQGVQLQFIESAASRYNQSNEEFVPNLSIIDVLMNCPPDEVVSRLNEFRLV